jgi:hypothetical protein
MKTAVICINQYLNIHPSIKEVFPDYDLFLCDKDSNNIQALCNKLNPFYTNILISSHNVKYKKGKSYMMEFQPTDYVGGDYFGMPYASLLELFNKTCDDPIALGFNNKGYIKKEIHRERLARNDYLGPNGGIYIYTAKLEGDKSCNIYLPSCMLDILSTLKLGPINIIPSEKTLKIAININGYLGGWYYIKDSFKNIMPINDNISYDLFAECYPVIQIGSTDNVSPNKLQRELCNFNLRNSAVSIQPQSQRLLQKWTELNGIKYDIIVNTHFNTIVDKEINYFDIQPGFTYQSNNDAITVYYDKYTRKETRELPSRVVDYDLGKSFTFVTCLLNIGRSNWSVSSKKFDDYINSLLKLTSNNNFNFYIYADEYYIDELTNKLSHRTNYKLIPINFNELYTYRYFDRIKTIMNSEFYISFLKHLGNNKVPQFCIPEYNTLINCKVDMLYKASIDNTFNTDYFVWVDLFDTDIPSYWNPLCINHPQHVMICNNNSIDNSDRSYLSYFKDFSEVISTNVFGGTSDTLNRLHDEYYKTLTDCLDKNITHNDTYIMTMCYKDNPKLFKVYSLRNDVLNSNTLSYNYFRLINSYRVAIILDKQVDPDVPNLGQQIQKLKRSNVHVDLYLHEELESKNTELKDLNPIKYIDRSEFPHLLDKHILKSGRHDCVICITTFNSDSKIDIQIIKQCVKFNTIKLDNSMVYGSYTVMNQALY